MLALYLGSLSKLKYEAVQEVLSEYNIKAKAIPYKVDSGVTSNSFSRRDLYRS
ncbi:hypothetical protein [Saccharolobus solfataricus]|uniref:Uncharacterized protein n=1 Tax=Saccharolobus solfataricus TaxID=2287 RepID=A0A7S9IKK6_SACSO|nr:hypothetical protein [Saccharolobus solfataricus]QPG50820.1 hypothetical protein HFC64_14275 [Saccharolobus solfataricus]